MLGANIPAIIRGLIAVAWYGIQTYLASAALDIVLSSSSSRSSRRTPTSTQHGFLGLSTLGWIGFAILWVAAGRRVLARHGDDPQVHRLLRSRGLRRDVHPAAVYLVSQGRLGNINLNLSARQHTGVGRRSPVMLGAIALVVSYFSGPDAQLRRLLPLRQDRSRRSRRATSSGLPVNFLFFSLLTVRHRVGDACRCSAS